MSYLGSKSGLGSEDGCLGYTNFWRVWKFFLLSLKGGIDWLWWVWNDMCYYCQGMMYIICVMMVGEKRVWKKKVRNCKKRCSFCAQNGLFVAIGLIRTPALSK